MRATMPASPLSKPCERLPAQVEPCLGRDRHQPEGRGRDEPDHARDGGQARQPGPRQGAYARQPEPPGARGSAAAGGRNRQPADRPAPRYQLLDGANSHPVDQREAGHEVEGEHGRDRPGPGAGQLDPGDGHLDPPSPRPVPLAKEDRLPRAKGELAAPHRGGARRTHERGLDVRVRVALRVLEGRLLRNELGHVGFDVRRDVGVSALVDGHAGRRVRDEHMARAVGYSRTCDRFGDALGDVDQLSAPSRADLEIDPAHRRSALGRDLLQDLERFADEGWDVRRLAGGHQVAVHYDLLVDDVRPGLLQVALDRLPRGHAVVLVLVSAQQQLRTVADREDRLARLHERLHERHRLVVGAELVRAPPAGDEQGIEFLRLYILERPVDLRRDLALTALKLGPGLEPDDGDRMTRLAERVVRLLELGILEFGPQHTRNFHGVPPWKFVPENHLTRVCPERPVGKSNIACNSNRTSHRGLMTPRMKAEAALRALGLISPTSWRRSKSALRLRPSRARPRSTTLSARTCARSAAALF